MKYPAYHHIFQDFNTSIILPFYKKIDEFREILPLNAKFFQRNGIEVIVVMDHPEGKDELLELTRQYPMINWIVLLNEQHHEWRNPAKAINVGIKASTKDYIMVCSPESHFQTDAVFLLKYYQMNYGACFTVGSVTFSIFGKQSDEKAAQTLPYGSILARKKDFERVGGYTEHFSEWGGEDDNLRAKMEYFGIKKVFVPDARLVHYERVSNGYQKRREQSRSLPEIIQQRSFHPGKADFLNTGWGSDFSGVLKDYHYAEPDETQCRTYLEKFENYEMSDPVRFRGRHEIIALVQAYNEAENIKSLLYHLENICDGVILLDDGSTDLTYDLAEHTNVIVKFKKKRESFDDLKNRNLLLDVVSFLNCGWVFYIDADERFDDRYSDLRMAVKTTTDPTIAFWLVNAWDNDTHYRTDLEDTGKYSSHGIFSRSRMFRLDKGRIQLVLQENRKLHFLPVPGSASPKPMNLLLIHYGMQDQQKRRKKHDFYMETDEMIARNYDKHYKHLTDEQIELKAIADIDLK